MIDLTIKILAATAIAGLSIGLATWAVLQLWGMESRRRERVEKRYRTMIEFSDFSEKQKYWLMNAVAPKLVAYQMVGSSSGLRFYALNEVAILILGLNIAIPALTAAFWPSQAMHGLAMIALSSGIGVVLTAWDKLEQNSARWQDYHDVAGQIEDALNELLTDTPNIPICEQYNQFVVEYHKIMELDRELQRKRVSKAQEAASESAESIKQGIQESRQQYRSKYENGNDINNSWSSPSSGSNSDRGVYQVLGNLGGDGTAEGRGDALSAQTIDRASASPDVWADSGDRPIDNFVLPAITAPPDRIEPVEQTPMSADDWPGWQAEALANADDDPITQY